MCPSGQKVTTLQECFENTVEMSNRYLVLQILRGQSSLVICVYLPQQPAQYVLSGRSRETRSVADKSGLHRTRLDWTDGLVLSWGTVLTSSLLPMSPSYGQWQFKSCLTSRHRARIQPVQTADEHTGCLAQSVGASMITCQEQGEWHIREEIKYEWLSTFYPPTCQHVYRFPSYCRRRYCPSG